MIALPSTFELNFVEAWQSSQTHRFRILEWSTRSCVDQCECSSQFFCYGDTSEPPFHLLPHCAAQISWMAHRPHHA